MLTRPIQLALLPTPLVRADRASTAAGVEVWVKRDDLTGSVLSGNKVRKLEFSLGEARRRGADVVLTCGGVQSNHARATALAAAQLGMRCHLFLRGAPPDVWNGNLLLDHLAGAEVHFITKQEYDRRKPLMQAAADDLAAAGATPFIIPEGASDGLGTLGYVAASGELAEQAAANDLSIDHVVCASGSGGTAAGLTAGFALAGSTTRVHGICVCDHAGYFEREADAIFDELRTLGLAELDLVGGDCHFVEGYKGRGYGLSTPEERDLLREVVRTEGLVLDPTYTLKAWRGMLGMIEAGEISRGETVVFVHTGGVFGLFGVANELGPGVRS